MRTSSDDFADEDEDGLKLTEPLAYPCTSGSLSNVAGAIYHVANTGQVYILAAASMTKTVLAGGARR